jgi:hypothetical protein
MILAGDEELFDVDDCSKAGILLGYLEYQPEEVTFKFLIEALSHLDDSQNEELMLKFLKEALTHLDDSQIEDLIQKYEDAWHEEDE